MIDASAIEGLVVATCAVGSFGLAIRSTLKKAREKEDAVRQKQIDDAIDKARLEDELRRLKGQDSDG